MEAMSTVGNESGGGRRRPGGAARGARAPPGHRAGVDGGARLPDRGRAGGRVRPALGRHAHVGADRRALARGRRGRRDGERRRGPAVRRRPAVPRGHAGEDLRGVRGDGRRRRADRRRPRDLGRRRRAAAGGDRRRLADRPERRLRHLGRAPARVQLPRQDPPGRGRELRDPDDAPEAVHRADGRPVRPLPGGGRPAPVAPRAHPLQGDRARPPHARDAGLLPRRPVPRERHDRRGQAGAGAAGRAARRAPRLRLRHRAGAGRREPLRELRARRAPLRRARRGRRGAAAARHRGARRRDAVGGARGPAADRRAHPARRA